MDQIPSGVLLGLLSEDEVVVVDCRSDQERAEIPLQVPGALQMPCEEIHASPFALPDDELIVLYGADGESDSTSRAARILELAGRRIALLQGGLRSWIGLGFPVERPPAKRPIRLGGQALLLEREPPPAHS